MGARRPRKRSVTGTVTVDNHIWSDGLQDDPWPRLIEAVERIAEALEAIQEKLEEVQQ